MRRPFGAESHETSRSATIDESYSTGPLDRSLSCFSTASLAHHALRLYYAQAIHPWPQDLAEAFGGSATKQPVRREGFPSDWRERGWCEGLHSDF